MVPMKQQINALGLNNEIALFRAMAQLLKKHAKTAFIEEVHGRRDPGEL